MVETILTPTPCETPTVMEEQNSFLIDNYFSELENDSQKGIARENLGVYGKTDLYTKVEVDNNIGKAVNDSVKQLLAADDPHQILPKVYTLLTDYVRKDGTTPFTAPQSGVDPLLDNHLTTKRFVNSLFDQHLKVTDPHNVMELVNEVLKQYPLSKDVCYKTDVFTKEYINKLIKSYVKTDGTTPFTAPQSGVTPVIDQHLATKRYVDNVMFKHDVSVDPHGFLTILNQRLGNYYKTTETYSKQETYSRAQIDQVINTLVTDAAYQAVKEHTRQFDPHNILKEVYKEHYIKRDGSTPFTSIQKGIDGIEDNDLATVRQIKLAIDSLQTELNKEQPVWVTSGPVQTTVGFMEDESSIPPTMTFQEIMDAIFYGKIVNIETQKIAAAGEIIDITMSVRGNSFFEKAELYQNGIIIGTYTIEDFGDWQHSVQSNPVLTNTVFDFKVYFTNGAEAYSSANVEVSYGIFVGAIPKICQPGDITRKVMLEMIENDSNCKMYYEDPIKHKFNFSGDVKKLVIAIPEEYKQLEYMNTLSQHFDRDAFNMTKVPIIVPGVNEVIIYNFYVYRENLNALNSEVIFKLS